jgi:hypothetical protein
MKPLSFAILSLLAITPCIGESLLSQTQAAETQPVTLNFEGMVGDQPFSCTESYRLGTAETMAMPTDFRLYVSDVALIDAEGNAVPLTLEQDGKWQYDTVALLDFEDRTGTCANGTPETRTQVVGTVPAGDYQGVQFTVGVPFDLNHDDATLAPSPLNLTSLWWNWRGGYKFLRVDLETHNMNAGIPVSAQGMKGTLAMALALPTPMIQVTVQEPPADLPFTWAAPVARPKETIYSPPVASTPTGPTLY